MAPTISAYEKGPEEKLVDEAMCNFMFWTVLGLICIFIFL